MKKFLLLAIFTNVLISCNVNPSKEARIQKLETDITTAIDKLKEVENRVVLLEGENAQLKTRIDVLELP